MASGIVEGVKIPDSDTEGKKKPQRLAAGGASDYKKEHTTMAHSCSDGAAKVLPSGAGNRPALLDLIIYVNRPCPK